MYSSLMPHLKKGAKETDLMTFDFEEKAIKTISEADAMALELEVNQVKDFWLLQDSKKNNC